MNPVLASMLTKVTFPQALITLLQELSDALDDRFVRIDNLDTHKSIDGVSDLVFLHLTDTELDQRIFVMVNDKDQTVSFGETTGCYYNAIHYAGIDYKMAALAIAYTVKEKTAAFIKVKADKDAAKYKTINFVTAKKYEGMNHDTLAEALDEVFQSAKKIKNSNNLGIRLEPIDVRKELVVEYVPSTHTLMVDGAMSKAVKAVIRMKMAEYDKEIAAIFN